MSIAVVGPGAIGAAIAARLVRAGTPPVLCGRTPHDELRVNDLVVPGPVRTDPGEVGPADLVFLAVKATQLGAVAGWLERLCTPETIVCVLQNGVEQRELVEPLARGATVVPAVVWIGAGVTGPGQVDVFSDGRVVLPAGAAGERVATSLAGSDVQLSDDFTTVAWHKLCANAVAGLMVLTRRPAGAFARDDLAALAHAYVDECAAVARAEGADLPADVADELVGFLQGIPPDASTSILVDAEAGRPLEWDVRNGVVRRRAARHGLATPISDVVVPLLAATSER